MESADTATEHTIRLHLDSLAHTKAAALAFADAKAVEDIRLRSIGNVGSSSMDHLPGMYILVRASRSRGCNALSSVHDGWGPFDGTGIARVVASTQIDESSVELRVVRASLVDIFRNAEVEFRTNGLRSTQLPNLREGLRSGECTIGADSSDTEQLHDSLAFIPSSNNINKEDLENLGCFFCHILHLVEDVANAFVNIGRTVAHIVSSGWTVLKALVSGDV